MMKAKLTLAAALAGVALCGQGAETNGTWIAYPGDYGIWAGNRLQAGRLQHGGYEAPFWPQYEPHSLVTFSKEFNLKEPETVMIYADGFSRVDCDRYSPSWDVAAPTNAFVVPAGKVRLGVKVQNSERPPALLIRGRNVFTDDNGWDVSWCPSGSLPAEKLTGCDDPGLPPGKAKLSVRREKPTEVRKLADGLLVDFGRETYGFPILKDVAKGGLFKIVYAESEAEALDGGDRACDSWEILDVPAGAEFSFPLAHGYRYLRLLPLAKGASVGAVEMDYEWKDIPRPGSFACDDETLNRIWQVGAYTLELTCREVFIEGVKRDHWVWSGDAVQSFLMNYYLYADYRGVRDTLWCVRGKDPVVTHLNSIMDYSFYWFDAVWKYYLYSGDRTFLRQVYPRMKSLMAFCEGRLDAKGRPAARRGDWMFIDWAPEALHNYGGVCSFEMMLYARALEAMAKVAPLAGEESAAAGYAARAAKVRGEVVPLFWDEKRGALMHLLKDDGTLDAQLTRYPNMFGLFFGYFSDEQRRRVVDGVILNDKVMKIQTPYMRFYELEALCSLGRQADVLKEIRSYWGDMLKLGATSFWELYNPAEKGAQHYAMYDRPFGKSLCHAWGASPVYLIGRYFLGVEPTAPGFSRYVVKPAPAGLKWMKGTVPTPSGVVAVEVRGDTATVTGPSAGEGELVWRGKTVRIPPGKRVEVK